MRAPDDAAAEATGDSGPWQCHIGLAYAARLSRTLADRFSQRDAERFVGREAELARFAELLVDDPPASVVMVHGPGGVGKSALLRSVTRLAFERGFSPWLIDARELAPVPGELETILAGARHEDRLLILFDTYERMAGLDGFLRREVLPALPENAIVVIAGRQPPDPGWLEGGWEEVVWTMALGPLTTHDSRRLVASYGVVDEESVVALLRWAGGSPLGLTLAAAVAVREGAWTEASLEQRPDLVESLVRRLALSQLNDEHADVTAVAAIARVTTAAMLADVLPATAPTEAQAWLRAQPVTEPVGDGVTMHDLVRKAVLSHLRATRPEHESELRRRIADHLFVRAAAGEPRLLVDLAELIENVALRWGYGAEGTADMRVDALRREDFEAGPAWSDRPGGAAWWTATRVLFETSAEHVVVARDATDAIRSLAISFTPANASEAALADPFAGDWIRHASEHAPDGNAIVWRDSLDLTASDRGDLGSRLLAIVNTAAVLRSGLVNPRCLYLPINPTNEGAVAFARHSGATHVEELDVTIGDVRHECHVIDHGPDGMLGSQRKIVYTELGLAPPAPAARTPPGAAVITADDVRQGLRDIDRPSALAGSPLVALTPGGDPAARVRALLLAAAEGAFGSGAEETLLRQVAHRAYVDHHTSHEQAAHDLHLSRATYFRRLRQVADRIADYVVALAHAGALPFARP